MSDMECKLMANWHSSTLKLLCIAWAKGGGAAARGHAGGGGRWGGGGGGGGGGGLSMAEPVMCS